MALQGDNYTWFVQEDFSTTVNRDDNGLVVVTLPGEFDLSTAPDLRECFAHPK